MLAFLFIMVLFLSEQAHLAGKMCEIPAIIVVVTHFLPCVL